MELAEVQIFLFERDIRGRKFCGEIPALSWNEAQESVSKFGGRVYGRQEESLCANCLIQVGGNTPEASPYDFPEVIDE